MPLFVTLAQSQTDKQRSTEAFQSNNNFPFPTEPINRRGTGPGLPPSSVVEIKTSVADLRTSLMLMQANSLELQQIERFTSSYPIVVRNASDIIKLARGLLRGLSLPRDENE